MLTAGCVRRSRLQVSVAALFLHALEREGEREEGETRGERSREGFRLLGSLLGSRFAGIVASVSSGFCLLFWESR